MFKKIKTEASEDELKQKAKQTEKLSKENLHLLTFCNDQNKQIRIFNSSKKKLEAIGIKLNNHISKTLLKRSEETAAAKQVAKNTVNVLKNKLWKFYVLLQRSR